MVLQRTFSSFPAGPAGSALLILRLVVGGSALIEACLPSATFDLQLHLIVRTVTALAGLGVIVGAFTPIASTIIAAVGTVILVRLPLSFLQLFDSPMALFELIVMAIVLVLLGPGAASCDALMFGRREVKIASARTRDPSS